MKFNAVGKAWLVVLAELRAENECRQLLQKVMARKQKMLACVTMFTEDNNGNAATLCTTHESGSHPWVLRSHFMQCQVTGKDLSKAQMDTNTTQSHPCGKDFDCPKACGVLSLHFSGSAKHVQLERPVPYGSSH